MSRSCSHCGNNGHNSRTCTESTGGESGGSPVVPSNGFMLFGVRVTESHFRKSVSMNNLSQYEQPQEPNPELTAGYVSDDVVHNSARNRERKRGVPWTEDEHRLFLLGLEKVGKGDWRGISRNFVKTRTPTQVASHAQKYFLRKSNQSRRRRRSSLFDITTDTFMGSTSMEEENMHQYQAIQSQNGNMRFPITMFTDTQPEPTRIVRPIPVIPVPPPAARIADLNLNQKPTTMDSSHLSLKLSLSMEKQKISSSSSSTTTRHSAFQAMSSFNTGELDSNGGGSIISVV